MTSYPHRRTPQPGTAARRALAVAGGGLIGSGIRVGVTEVFGGGPASWPMATLAVNLVGAFVLGWYLSRRLRAATSPLSVPFWAIGMLGSLTTFSAFGVETVRLAETDTASAFWYVAISVVGGLAAAVTGRAVGRAR